MATIRSILGNTHGTALLLILSTSLMASGLNTPLWTAYNDHYAGKNTSPNATAWNVFGTVQAAPGNSGLLKNAATGASLSATLTITSKGQVSQGTTAGTPNAGTPAYNLFNGFIDWSNGQFPSAFPSAPTLSAGASIDYTFSGLTSGMSYNFIGTGLRGGTGGNYALRWTLIEIIGAELYTPAHTSKAGAYTNGLSAAQVAINTGQNRTTGDYASWQDIDPGKDGTFTIRCTQYTGPIPNGTAGGNSAYGLMAIRLQEFSNVPIPVAITTQPLNQTVGEFSPVEFHVGAFGVPLPTYQWYLNGAPIPGAVNEIYSLLSAPYSHNKAQFHVIANNQIENVSHWATSSVAILTVLLDKNLPTLEKVLPPAQTLLSELKSIELFFSKPVTNIFALDLLINGIPATQIDEITSSQYLFSFPEPTTGTVHVAWSPNHQITDLTFSSNRFAGEGWTYRYTTNLDYSFIQINEFMAANRRFVRDEDGEYSDWIELYNSGPFTMPLAGCFLTDNPLNLTKWKFPPVSMTPKSFLIIWASGKDRTNSTAPLHANFPLNRDGGYLAFVQSDGANIISDITSYPSQTTDVSFGRDRTDPQITGFFTTPTPGAANSTAGLGFGPEVFFSRESGTFTTSFSLRLSSTDTNAVIRYTIGTNMPTATSTLYTGPITITRSTQVRARTFVPELLPGNIQSKEYIQLDTTTTNVIGLKTKLPIVVFHNYGGGAVPAGENAGGYAQFAMIQVFEPKDGFASLTNIPNLTVLGTIHRRGQATRYNAKANLRVEITDEYGAGKSVPFLGMPEENDWIFYAINGYDKVLMHNPLAHGLYTQMGHYTSRTRYVEVYLKDDSGQPGPITAADYNGIYVVEEKIKIDKNRVDIDKLQPENTTEPSITGGYIFSVDKDGPSPSMNAANSSLWNLDPDGPTLATPQRLPQKQYIVNYLNAFYSALTGSNWTDPVKGYAAYIDVNQFVDYHLHNTFVFNADMLRISTYYCKPRNGKIAPAALWDFDRAFGMYSTDRDQRGFNPWRWRSGSSDGGTDPFNASNTYHNPWYGRLFTDPDFWQKWIDRYQELRMSVYSYSNVTAMIQKCADEVGDATPREYARWAGQGTSDTNPNQGVVTGDGWTYTFPTPGTWAGEVQFIKTWFTNRMIFMDTNFLAQPSVSRPGGLVDIGTTVTLTPAAKAGSAVLYTLDGSDPRLTGGSISPKALSSYSSVTITITNNTRLFARSHNSNHRNLTGANNPPISSPWSGVTADTYYTSIPALRITEIMYHPSLWPPGFLDDPGYFEFIELSNTGNNPLSLIGFTFTKGIKFAFTATNRITQIAPGGKILLVKNIAAFSQRYPDAVNLIAGEYSDSLNNAGDRLVLVGPFGEPIHDLAYHNSPATDGVGFSLVIKDENLPLSSWNNPVQWRSSSYLGGSPGTTDAAPVAIQPVIVNEVLSSPLGTDGDAVELYNPNPTTVDISYWFLTDNIESPQKYQIPPGTLIPSLGYCVFNRTNSFGLSGVTNYFGGLNNDFGFDSGGDAVYLFSGDQKGGQTGYYHGFGFGAASVGVSFGRYTNSIGNVMIVAQKYPTLGAENSGPLVGPIIISDILFEPSDLIIGGTATLNFRDEYIVLHNNSGQLVSLYDPQNPVNTWHIRGGVSYDFPTGVTMPPGGYLALVSFSPSADPDSLAAFMAQYDLPPSVPVYGPFIGKLNNAGDDIRLQRPGELNSATGSAPRILVDSVEYGVSEPWPAATKATGAGLHRKDYRAFGKDPASWLAIAPAPAQGAPPTIIAGPRPQVAASSTTASFSVSANDESLLQYQWYWNKAILGGSDAPVHQLPNVGLSDAGLYMVAVIGAQGTAVSSSAPLVVIIPPANQTVTLGSDATLRAVVSAPSDPFAIPFQWSFKDSILNHGTNATVLFNTVFTNEWILHNLSAEQEGAYAFTLTSESGEQTVFAANIQLGNSSNQPVNLSITYRNNQAILSWPNSPVIWTLEEADMLVPGTIWRTIKETIELKGNRWEATIPSPTSCQFFRLRWPGQ